MKLLIFSDIHSDLKTLERLMETEADYYFAAGDMVSWARGLDAVGHVLARRADRMCVIPGNHESERDISKLCLRFGFQNLHRRSLQVDGYHVAGLGCSSPTPFATPGEYSEAQFEEALAPFSALQPLILLCHCPPMNTDLDLMSNGEHAGSLAIRKFIESRQPDYFFCGHIHEAHGRAVRIGRSLGVNVGKQGYLLDFDKLPV